jgi:hypothetical protein
MKKQNLILSLTAIALSAYVVGCSKSETEKAGRRDQRCRRED